MKRIFLFVLFSTTALFSQSELQVSGFFQAGLSKIDGAYSVTSNIPPSLFSINQGQKDDYISAQVQQMNLFFRKELNENFTAWANLEIVNSFNSKQSWGSFSLEEAWVNYQYSNYFNVKAGSLIPRFGYMNEIKNRMPLLPYITRPLIYEASIDVITASNFVPEKAFLQVYGYFPIGDVTIDYAAFAGNSEKSYITSNNVALGSGSDTTKFKAFGGRIGAKFGELRGGISTSFDRENHQVDMQQDIHRVRYAVDLGYSAYNFFADGEFIYVKLQPNSPVSVNMDKKFYYATLGYNFSEKIFGFATHSYVQDNHSQVFQAGMKSLSFGAGYKPAESVVVKVGYTKYYAANFFPIAGTPFTGNVNLDYKAYQLAVSVLF